MANNGETGRRRTAPLRQTATDGDSWKRDSRRSHPGGRRFQSAQYPLPKASPLSDPPPTPPSPAAAPLPPRRSEPVELAPLLARLQEQADVLPVAALAEAARAHLRFLTELAAREGVRRREILVVLSTRARETQNAQLELTRRAGEAQELLRAAGVELRPLDGDQAAALLARALDPPGPPLGATLEGVVRAC